MHKTILIVEDSSVIRTTLAPCISAMERNTQEDVTRIEVVEALNGKQALEYLRSFKVDLIFLDLAVAGVDGLTLLRIAKSDPQLSTTPVIVCGDRGEEEGVEEALRLGASACITRPLNVERAHERFRKALTQQQEATGPGNRGEVTRRRKGSIRAYFKDRG